MDTVLLFALPLVGGLIFCSNWNVTRWRVAREDGHRLYFRAVLFGALLFALIAILHPQIECAFPTYSSLISSVKEVIKPMAKDAEAAPAVADLAITCFLAMLAGWPAAKVLNLFFKKQKWLRRAIMKDELEGFLLMSADRKTSIAVTMDDGKVYVGFVVKGFDPAVGRKCIFLLPLMSGYRDDKTHKVHFTTFYTKLYGGEIAEHKAALPDPLSHLTPEDFITVLTVDRIVSYRLFDATAYLEFQKATPQRSPSANSASAAKSFP